jgi:dTMP kinase
MTRPIVVVLEGIDGGGKTAHAKRVHEHLLSLGRTAHLYRDPGGTPTGEQIRTLVKSAAVPMHQHTQFLLFCAARAELATAVCDHLEAGHDVVLDRWWYSTFCYQGADGIDEEAIMGITNHFATLSFAAPAGEDDDLLEGGRMRAYHLHVTPDEARKRTASATRVNDARVKDRYESKPAAYLDCVYNRYLTLEARGYLTRVETTGRTEADVWENLRKRVENQINQYG